MASRRAVVIDSAYWRTMLRKCNILRIESCRNCDIAVFRAANTHRCRGTTAGPGEALCRGQAHQSRRFHRIQSRPATRSEPLMSSCIRAKILPLAITALLAATPVLAQDTSSAISGRVLDSSGQPVAGATVKIVHEPSGTTKITTTDADGRYAAQGLRVGGPFDVTASKAGLTQAEQDKVYLQLSQ